MQTCSKCIRVFLCLSLSLFSSRTLAFGIVAWQSLRLGIERRRSASLSDWIKRVDPRIRRSHVCYRLSSSVEYVMNYANQQLFKDFVVCVTIESVKCSSSRFLHLTIYSLFRFCSFYAHVLFSSSLPCMVYVCSAV